MWLGCSMSDYLQLSLCVKGFQYVLRMPVHVQLMTDEVLTERKAGWYAGRWKPWRLRGKPEIALLLHYITTDFIVMPAAASCNHQRCHEDRYSCCNGWTLSRNRLHTSLPKRTISCTSVNNCRLCNNCLHPTQYVVFYYSANMTTKCVCLNVIFQMHFTDITV